MSDLEERIRRELERLQPSPGGLEKTLRRVRRRERSRRAGAGAIGLVLTAGLAVGLWVSLRQERPVPVAPPSPSPEPTSAGTRPVPEGRLVFQLNSGIEVLPQGARRSLSLGGGRIFAYGVSPDGTGVLAATYVREPTGITREGELLILDAETGAPTVLVRAGPKEDLGPAVWSPDGSAVAYRLTVYPFDPAKRFPRGTAEQTVCVVEVATTASRCFPDLGTVDAFSWSPDGRQIVDDGVGGELPLRLLDLETGRVSDFASPRDPALVAALGGEPPRSFVFAEWSPSGRYVATHAHLRAAAIFDSGGRFVMLGHETQEFTTVFTWSPTQDLLAYAVGRPPYAITDLYVLDPATGEDRLLYSTGEGARAPQIIDAAWSPTGRWLAVAIAERTLHLAKSVLIIEVTRGDIGSVLHLGPADGADVLVGWGP